MKANSKTDQQASSKTSSHILIVEDDPDGQALVAYILDYLTIPIDIADDAEQAGELLFVAGNTYRAAIIDL
ncbi:MAG TPA: hypothetical protein VHL11_11210, partial [Phototrophicaceae bacterium]|nr:hypothetical protein [Phototrophicaceae bacterium]